MSGDFKLEGRNGVLAVKMLKRVSRLLEKNNIPYILEAGTLLGVIRENRLLPWDNDIDLTITRPFEKRLLKNIWKLRFFGYKVQVKYYKKDLKFFKSKELRIIKIWYLNPLKFFKREVVLDIFIKRKIGEEYFWTEGLRPPVLKVVPAKFHDNLTQITFKKKKFSVPNDYEGYLVCLYGKDWRTPVKNWDFKKDSKCTKEYLE